MMLSIDDSSHSLSKALILTSLRFCGTLTDHPIRSTKALIH
jgi:hypothetical protein